ncbi:hypothetical protein EJ05DRAFT_475798 [Pseudovirgaria hyperparasitica]|uniref:Zn(2)-C6 fungal-type domain-containing protein n=1 Tax=Pseudovirgaria hyperparasitica TaxID=470096 RepID=A0A6A6W785_9PEZI|nr:uncharacterized protein EJ05DRAFT_475798 [Pseudovirgaria hyperparasitica]KAF2758493.1 hypothetical protein EJ05DRAFT_475798 [Pseudovirgaria hyperparasitica]
MSARDRQTAAPTDDGRRPSGPTSVKPYACVLCSRRKVRCDRLVGGCTNCTKARVECVYIAPAPPRRRKRGEKPPETDLVLKLKRYEELLTRLGVRLDGDEQQSSEQGDSGTATARLGNVTLAGEKTPDTDLDSPGLEYGMVIGDKDNTRYLANQLYADVGQEYSKEILEESTESESDDLPFDTPGSVSPDASDWLLRHRRQAISLTALHPSPVVIFQLWQKFLENVNPMVKVLHVPTAQQTILEATSNLINLTKSTEALMFVVYFAAIVSLSNEECEYMTGEPKSVLQTRYRFAVQQALANAGLLRTSELVTLQAFQIFLFAMHGQWDPKSFWALTGIAVRIGQRMGLHRDGSKLGLSIFQTELRRRLWWEMVIQDARAGEMAGCGGATLLWDTLMPLNIEDTALNPNMQEPPLESVGPTEMIFPRVRYEIGDWLRKRTPASAYHGAWVSLMSANVSKEEKQLSIDELEDMFERKYLRHADMSVPVHFLAFAVVRSVMAKMRFMTFLRAHRLGQNGEGPQESPRGAGLSEETQFLIAIQIVEYDTLIQQSPIIERFRWHVVRQFQWQPFIYLLGELRQRTSGEDVNKAWRAIGVSYSLHPEIIAQTKRALHVAVGGLTLQAWAAFEAANGRDAYTIVGSGNGPPRYILDLRSQRRHAARAKSAESPSKVATETHVEAYPDFFGSTTTEQYPSSAYMAQQHTSIELGNNFYQTPATMQTPATIETTPSDVFTGLDAAAISTPSFGGSGDAGGYMDMSSGPATTPLNWGEWEHLVQDFQTETWNGFDVDVDADIGL